jgi:NAD(P)-dependent dehydrogenase (short-subunit alcohol dehydrogenase family)
MRFAGKVALITGAGRGMGKSIAAAFAREEAAVGVCDIVADRAQAATQTILDAGGRAIALTADVSSEADVKAMTDRLVGEYGRIDVLVNVAGAYGLKGRATHEMPESEWDLVLDSNLKGSFVCAKFVLPYMLRQGDGRIVNFASNAARSYSPWLGACYTVAKTGILGLTRHLAREYADRGIRVNTIAPGPTKGDRVMDLVGDADGEREMAAMIPMGRLGEAKDIAKATLFVASDDAAFITGAILDVNGGFVLA